MSSKNKITLSKKNVSVKKRIMQRVIIALIFSGSIIFAEKMGWLDHFADTITKEKINWTNNQQVVQYLKQIITDKKLSDIPSKCLIPVINNDDGSSILNVEIHAKHNQECVNTQTNFPTIFTFRINRLNGNIQFDKGSPNHFYPLP